MPKHKTPAKKKPKNTGYNYPIDTDNVDLPNRANLEPSFFNEPSVPNPRNSGINQPVLLNPTIPQPSTSRSVHPSLDQPSTSNTSNPSRHFDIPQSTESRPALPKKSKVESQSDKAINEFTLFWDDQSDDFFELLLADGVFDEKKTTVESTVQVQKPDGSTSESLAKKLDAKSDRSYSTHDPTETPVAVDSSFYSQKSFTQGHSSQNSHIYNKGVCSQSNSQAHTTEWLRNQLEKVNRECSQLKEKLFTKEGETKILRNHLKEANSEIERQRADSELARQTLKTGLEAKIISLQKQLELSKTQMLISTGETKSRMGNLSQTRKIVPVPMTSRDSRNKSFKDFLAEKEKASRSISNLTQKKNPKATFSQGTSSSKEPTIHSTELNKATSHTRTAFEIKKDTYANMLAFTKRSDLPHLGKELKCLIDPYIFEEAQPEFSFIVPPSIDYYPFNILYRDVSEIPINESSSVQKQLKSMWKVKSWKINERGTERTPIKRSRYFTSLKDLYPSLNELCRLPIWDSNFHIDIIQHVTKMARELFVALRDPAVMSDTSIHRRENEIVDECLDTSELKEYFNPFLAKKWKREIYIDLRRGIALIGALCELDQRVAKSILQDSGFIGSPKDYNNFRMRRKPSKSTGSWFNGELYLTTPSKVVFSTFKSPKMNNIYQRDNFAGGRSEVGPVAILFHKLTLHDCRVWEKRYKALKARENLIPQPIQFFDELFSQLNALRRTITSYGLINCQPSPALLGIETSESDDVSFTEDVEEEEEDEDSDDSLMIEFDPDSSQAMDLFLDFQIAEYWSNIESAVEPLPSSGFSEIIETPHDSLMSTIMERDEMQWVSRNLASLSINSQEPVPPSVIERMSSNSCISEEEKSLLSAAFHNFLKIKSSVTGEEKVCLCQACGPTNEHGLFDFHDEPKGTKKRRIDLNSSSSSSDSSFAGYLPLSSSSSSSSSSGSRSSNFKFIHKKYDLAPLKKSNKIQAVHLSDIEEMDIIEEVNKIYEKNAAQEPTRASASLKNCDDVKTPEEKVEKMETNQLDEVQKSKPTENRGEKMEISQLEEVVKTVPSKKREKSPKKVTTPKKDKTPEERAVECNLLDILMEIVKRISLMRFTINFNSLFDTIIRLLQSSLKLEAPISLFRPQRVYSMVLEILYCRPSPIVLRSVNQLLVQIMPMDGFAKLSCHNAHPITFYPRSERISFKRGACLLSTICTLVEFSINDEDWEIQFHFFRWMAFLMLSEKTVIDNLYDKQRTSSLRCLCVMILNNTVMTILCKAAYNYYKRCLDKKLTPLLKSQLTEIIENGIRMVAVIVETDKFFAKNTHNHYESFYNFLETITLMHSPNQSVFDIQLQEQDLKIVKQLLEEETMARRRKKGLRGGPKDLCRARDIFQSVPAISVRHELFSLVPLSEASKIFFDSDEESV